VRVAYTCVPMFALLPRAEFTQLEILNLEVSFGLILIVGFGERNNSRLEAGEWPAYFVCGCRLADLSIKDCPKRGD
jgi:hypothetical protein